MNQEIFLLIPPKKFGRKKFKKESEKTIPCHVTIPKGIVEEIEKIMGEEQIDSFSYMLTKLVGEALMERAK